MIDFLIKSSACLLVFLTFYHLVLAREKIHRFNRFYLLITLILSLTIPFVTYEIIEIIPVQASEPVFIPQFENVRTTAIVEKVNLIPIILWSLYGIITTLFMLRFAKNIFKIILKLKLNEIANYKNATLVLVEEKTLPHSFLNYIFINSDDYNNQKIEDELYTHELVHVTQKHTLDILFIELLKCFFWFNPLFILYKKAIQLNHEFLADEEIVKTYNNVPFYQSLLLQKSSENQTVYLASNLNYLVTKKRLLMMTKNTSKRLAILKKIAIVPILAGLIYFFCVEVVAQEKIVNTKSEISKSKITNKDKIRDSYYSGVYVKLFDEKTSRNEVTLYEDLSVEDKRKYLDNIPEIQIEKEIPELLFERLKTKNWKIGINNKLINKQELKNYKRTDFSYYSYSMVDKSDKTEKFPMEYQYILYTKDYFAKNMKDSHIHFKGDTIKIVNVNYKTVMKNKIAKSLISDTLVWYTKGKEGYNLYLNDSVKKKNNTTNNRKDNIETKKVENKKETEYLNNGIVEKLSEYDTEGKNEGYIYMKNATYFYKNEKNTIEYYNRWGKRVNENGEVVTQENIYNVSDVDEKPDFIGGISEFYKFIAANFKVSEEMKNGGKIFISFTIEKDGSLTDIKTLRDFGFGSGDEATRVLKLSPNWKPGKLKNKVVRVKYQLPISINKQ